MSVYTSSSPRTPAERFVFSESISRWERYVFWLAALFFFCAASISSFDIGIAWHEALGLSVLLLIASYLSDLRVQFADARRTPA